MATLSHIIALLVIVSLTSSSVVKSPAEGNNFELLILHDNDMHARFDQTSQLSGVCTSADSEAGKCYGGFARVAHVVKKARAEAASGEGPPVLYLNAGDTYTGTAWFTIYKWKIAAEFINALQPDAISLGNHEFDDGVSGLVPYIENITCPILACNLVLDNEPTLKAQSKLMSSIILNVNNTKIGIIGYLTPKTKMLAIRNNIRYIEEVVAIKQEIAKLKNQNVNIFIALGHSGYDKDLEIATEVEDIDLVIGGHSNTFLWNGASPDVEKSQGPYPTLIKQKSGRSVLVVQAYAYTKYLGKLHIVFDSNGEIKSFDGHPILLNNFVLQDPEVKQLTNKYRNKFLQTINTVIGNTSVILDAQSCRTKECNIGNLITDAMIYKYARNYSGIGWTDAPVAIVQGGTIRASIANLNYLPAAVTKGDLLTTLPFSVDVIKVSINGSTVWKMLEHAVENYASSLGTVRFLHFSGLKVEYDFGQPPGKRVIKAYIRCGTCYIPDYSLLDITESYNILMTRFLSAGGDGYSMFVDLPSVALPYSELLATREYIQSHSPVYPAIERRVVIHNADKLIN